MVVTHSEGLLGGSEKSLLELILLLKREPDFDVVVVVPGAGDFEKAIREHKIPCRILPYSWAASAPTTNTAEHISGALYPLEDIYTFLQDEKPDVVVTNTSVVPWFAYAANKIGVPHIWFIRELLYPGDYVELPVGMREYFSVSGPQGHFFTNSQAMKSIISEHIKSEVQVVYPPIRKSPHFAHAPTKSAINPLKPKLFILGTVNKNKNQLEALRAVKLLKKQGIEPVLTIVGQPDQAYKKVLQRYISANKLAKNVVMHDYIKDPFSLMQRQDICLVTSTFEAFGRVTVEGMLLGVPVIVADKGGSTEIVQDGQFGLMYKSGDANDLAKKITDAISNPQETTKLVAAAHAYATKKFLDRSEVQKLVTAIREAPKKNPDFTPNWIDHALLRNSKLLQTFREELASANVEVQAQKAALLHLHKELRRVQDYPEWRIAILPRKFILWVLRLLRLHS